MTGENLTMNVNSGTTNTEMPKPKMGRPKLTDLEKKARKFEKERLGKTSTIEVSAIKKRKKKRAYKKSKRVETQEFPVSTGHNLSEACNMDRKTETQSRFTVKEIVDIIRTGKESNLSIFRYMGLDLYFSLPEKTNKLPRVNQIKTDTQIPKASILGWNEAEDKKVTEEISDLFLSDPMAAEQRVMDDMAKENSFDEGEIS